MSPPKRRELHNKTFWLCVKAVTEPDSAETTENTERSGPNLRKLANKYDLLLPVCSGTGSICKVC